VDGWTLGLNVSASDLKAGGFESFYSRGKFGMNSTTPEIARWMGRWNIRTRKITVDELSVVQPERPYLMTLNR
jgi:hypothetical protein